MLVLVLAVDLEHAARLSSVVPGIGSGRGIVPVDRPRPGVVSANSPNRATGAWRDRCDHTIRWSGRRRWWSLWRGVLAWARAGLPPRHERPGGRHADQGHPGQPCAAHGAASAAQPGGTPAGQAGHGHDGRFGVRAAPMAMHPPAREVDMITLPGA
jgi:hypothetical protein